MNTFSGKVLLCYVHAEKGPIMPKAPKNGLHLLLIGQEAYIVIHEGNHNQLSFLDHNPFTP